MTDDEAFFHCVHVHVRSGGFYTLVPLDYRRVLEAWTKGEAFLTGLTSDGEEATIKLANVECVMLCTPASLEKAVRRRRAESKAEQGEEFT